MIYLDFDLGQRKKGEIFEVTLTGGANVQLMDAANFSNYKNNQRCRYYGGLVRQTPYRLAVPEAGHWHVIIDTRGLGNTTVATVKMLSDSKQIYGKKCSKDG